MKRKIFALILCALILGGGMLTKKFLIGSRPLGNLKIEEVVSATVELYPPDAAFELSRENLERLIAILNRVVTYQRDDSYGEYCGQAVIFTLTKTDGTQLRVQAYNPFIVIDGVGYRTKYQPCQDLNQLGNDKLRELRHDERNKLLHRDGQDGD